VLYVAVIHEADRGSNRLSPAPNLAELAKMLIPRGSIFDSDFITVPLIRQQLMHEISNKTDAIKSHWETL